MTPFEIVFYTTFTIVLVALVSSILILLYTFLFKV